MPDLVELRCRGNGINSQPITFGLAKVGDEKSAAIQIANHLEDFGCTKDMIEIKPFTGWTED